MDVFQAIADERRRAIIELVAQRERTAGEVATHFDVSRPAISQHLSLLVSAGVLTVQRAGRERRYSLEPKAFAEVGDWLSAQGRRWDDALDRLEAAIREDERDEGEASHGR